MAFRQLEPLGPGEDRARLHGGDGGKDDIHRILVALVIIEGIEMRIIFLYRVSKVFMGPFSFFTDILMIDTVPPESVSLPASV